MAGRVTSLQRISSGSRLAAIDQFRGFAIFLMVLADFLGDVESVPTWLKHAPDVGYTIIDLIAPIHGILIGVFMLPAAPGLYIEAPLWLAALETAALVGVLSLIARYLRIRGWFFTL